MSNLPILANRSNGPVEQGRFLSLAQLPSLNEVKLEKARRHLHSFIQYTWDGIFGGKRGFVDGWHIGCICEHLEAITSGQIRRLIINMPPRHMKSLTCSVFWPDWEWLQDPGIQGLYTSYAKDLTVRDSVRSRRLINTPRYQELIAWCADTVDGYRAWELTGDVNAKERFENDQGGYRIATSVCGKLTGEGGDRIVVDDPHNVIEGESEVKRKSTIMWFDESLTSRVNDPKTSAFLINQQRIHEGDLSGHLLKEGLEDEQNHEWELLCLPGFFEGEQRSRTSVSFIDPRKKHGEVLWPQRFDEEELERLATNAYVRAGQIQQRPAPRGGGFFDIASFRIVKGTPPPVWIVRYWDKAGTTGGGARTAGVKMGLLEDGMYIVLDVVLGQWAAYEREKRIRQTAELDGDEVEVFVEQEPGSGGKESKEGTIRRLAGFIVAGDRVTGSKETRAEPYSVQVAEGNVMVVASPWAAGFIREHEKFPTGLFRDQVDAAAGAFNKLAMNVPLLGTW